MNPSIEPAPHEEIPDEVLLRPITNNDIWDNIKSVIADLLPSSADYIHGYLAYWENNDTDIQKTDSAIKIAGHIEDFASYLQQNGLKITKA